MTSSRNIHKQQQQQHQGPEEALVVVVDRLDNKLNFKTPRTQNKKKILGPEETRVNSTTTTSSTAASASASATTSPTTSMMDNNNKNNINNKLSESETYSCSTTQSHEEEEEEEKMLAGQQQEPQEQQDQQEPQQDQQQDQDQQQQRRRQQQQLDEFREAIDHELKQLNLPNIESQLKNNRKLMLKERNALIPTTIVVNIKDDDNDGDDDIDNCSLVSGLTLPQEIVLLRTIADNSKKAKAMKSKNKTSSSSSSLKARNKVSSKDHGTNRSNSHRQRRRRRPTTDQGDLQPNRAHDLEIQLILNGQLMKGTYSGALSHGAPPRKPNGVGVIKFDNGDMYMGDVQNGKLHGNGTLVNGDTVLRGEFENNLFVL